MKTQVVLLLICMLFSKAMSLNCYQCLPSLTGPCTNEQITCSDQCASTTMSVYTGDTKLQDVSVKTCSVQELCVSGSMNLGITKVTNNAQCCSTNLCNSVTLPALPKQVSNGRMCYTCDSNDCSRTVNCEGTEDRCISASVKQGGNTVSIKGCVSRGFCSGSGSTNVPGIGSTSVQCCEGNLCNGAEAFTLSFVLMIVPLISSILFS
ncbi:urokinase plasminogen activator surface receptor-like [Tachysurus fulvidraco]|uniref:urokinase plasminogen activator surface receptor-like n=1 Tax=Tachysurus fulvidraco TaxID=1234273 RepID=UPI001FF01D16|nr:urokinase plasminogen activator surface receptor-like [Tachysurus fulvidraco]